MFVINPTLTYQLAVADGFLDGLDAVPIAALMVGPTVRLYTDAHLADPRNDLVGSFTQATFQGYTAQAITLDDPVNNGNGGRARHAEANFLLGSPAGSGEIINGCYITNVAGTVLYAQAEFAEPVALAIAGDEVSLDIVFPVAFEQQVRTS